MDDLDHSIHIAECDWTCFYEESEECCFLQPSLAGLENSSLSDSEDSGSPVSPALDTGQLYVQRNTATTIETFQPSAGGHGKAEERYSELSVHIYLCGSGEGQPHDHTVQTKEGSVLLRSTVALENSLESQQDSEICLQYHGENIRNSAEGITQVADHSMTNYMLIAQQYESTNVQCSASNEAHDVSASTDLQREDGAIQRESGTIDLTFIQEPASLIGQHAELNVNTLHNTDRTESVSKTDSSVAPTTEKERWFVTVNDSPLRQRVPAGASATKTCGGKKKRRKKKPFKNTDPMCSDGKELPLVSGPELQRNEANESEAEEDNEHFTQSYRNSGTLPSAQISTESSQKGLISELPKMYTTSSPFDEENVSQKLSHFTPTVSTESYMDDNKCDTYCSAVCLVKPVSLQTSTIHDTFTLIDENSTLQDDVESEDLEDSAEFFSTNSYDSENYLSATESTTEDPEHIIKDCLTEQQPVDLKQFPEQCTLSPTTLSNLFMFPEMADTKDTEIHPCDIQNVHFSTVSNDEASTAQLSLEKYSPKVYMPQQSKGYEDTVDQAYAKPAMTFPSTGQSMRIKLEEDNSTSDNEKHSSASHVSLEAPGVHKPPTDNKTLTHSDLVKDQPESPPIPDFTVTPCSESESPETYAESLGPNRPVYAISAFWDEMEKLTIKDILQLRMARSPSPKEKLNIQETARPQVDVADTQTSSSVDTAEYLLPDSALMDTSDTADSDYFTQLDDSKQDRSSCEFSISDFDEEYLQFISASRNPTPEPQDLKQQSQKTTDLTCDLQKEDTNCMGRETPIDVDQLAGHCFEDHPSNILITNELPCPGTMTKSKSMHNVLAHDAEIQDVPSESVLEKRLLSNCPATAANTCIMLRTRTPPPLLSYTDILHENYQIFFPEVFEYLFMEDEPKGHSRTVTVYDSKATSEAEMYGDTLSQYEHEMFLPPPQCSKYSEGKPIPIFSCSHPPVRDLTFPELDYLFFSQDPCAESEEEDDCSPIRVVSRSHIQARDSSYFSIAPDGPLLNKRGWSRNWSRLFSLRRGRFPDMGRRWCRRSGAWMFPVEDQKMPVETASQATMLNERSVTSFSSQIFWDSTVQQRLFRSAQKTLSLSQQEGLFSTLGQSDMCLVCIAIASWVLRSSDPQAADTWKAALLANVSAISAIQYLRHYVKDRPQDEP